MKTAIVIGGGIAGCSTAYALARRGFAVTLIERHEKLAQEASGNPLAMLYPKLSATPSSASMLGLQGFIFTLNLLKNLPDSPDYFDACGQLQLAFNQREQAKQAALANDAHLLHSGFQQLNANETSAIAGITLRTSGLYLPQAGWVKPAALCQALCCLPQITIVTTRAAFTIEKPVHSWQVSSANHVFEADIVVICNANDIKQFSQCSSAVITPVRGQLNWFKATTESAKIKTIICGDHHVSPAVDGWHYIGTSYAPNVMNTEINTVDTQQNLNMLNKISPDIYQSIDLSQVQARVACRSQTLDYMPLAGQLLDETEIRAKPPRYNTKPNDLPWATGLYVNAGHGSKGMITAPLCAELIACLASNSALPLDTKLASKLNPSRFLLRELSLKQLAASLY